MKFNPKLVSETLDKLATYIEKSPELDVLSNEVRSYFAYKLDSITDEFDKVATQEGYRTKNGMWLMGDEDEDRYMKRYDEPGAIISDEDEERYMSQMGNPIEELGVAEHQEPPIRDLQNVVKYPGKDMPDSRWRDKSLPEGNVPYTYKGKEASGEGKKFYRIPKIK